jgi:threonine synthase
MEAFACQFCQKFFPIDPFQTFCPDCHEPLLYKKSQMEKKFHLKKDHPLEAMLDFLPLDHVNRELSLEEGNTPLIRLMNIEQRLGLPSLFAKNETVNPTFSFKDRGTAVAVQKAAAFGIEKIGTVSTGNMAASTAAYGARAGLKTLVLVKEDTPREKLLSISVHNPVMVRVKGDYGKLFRKSLSLAAEMGVYFMNSVDPFRLEGYKVTGLEIYIQLAQQVPDYIFVPVSAGGHLVGIIRAFQELKRQGYIQKYPRFIGVQANGCSPIAQAFQSGSTEVKRVEKADTVALAISNPDPPAGNLLLRLIKETGGSLISIPDENILAAQRILAEQEGLYVQPASATTLGGLIAFAKKQKLERSSRAVLILTGSGLRAPRKTSPLSSRTPQSSLADLRILMKSIKWD